jgi:hypothetical protein
LVDDGKNNGNEVKGFNYDILVEEALKNVVKKVIKLTSEKGLIGDSHFFISFNGNNPGAVVPAELKSEDNSEIKIIIQHQFWDLISTEDHFEVTLSFNGNKKKIFVPYNSITSFTDPSVGFGLQFKFESPETFTETLVEKDTSKFLLAKETDTKDKEGKKSGEIVSLDAFRDKK